MEAVAFRNLVLGKRTINYTCITPVRRDAISDSSDTGVTAEKELTVWKGFLWNLRPLNFSGRIRISYNVYYYLNRLGKI